MTILDYLQVDSGEGRRQTKMAANSKSHAVFQMAYTGANGNLYTIWEMACGMKGLKGFKISLLNLLSLLLLRTPDIWFDGVDPELLKVNDAGSSGSKITEKGQSEPSNGFVVEESQEG